jgi:hypothetical protein
MKSFLISQTLQMENKNVSYERQRDIQSVLQYMPQTEKML